MPTHNFPRANPKLRMEVLCITTLTTFRSWATVRRRCCQAKQLDCTRPGVQRVKMLWSHTLDSERSAAAQRGFDYLEQQRAHAPSGTCTNEAANVATAKLDQLGVSVSVAVQCFLCAIPLRHQGFVQGCGALNVVAAELLTSFTVTSATVYSSLEHDVSL